MQFLDRVHAGRDLADWFFEWEDTSTLTDPLVLAPSRGGVLVAAEVARAVRAPLDVLPARKIRLPGRPATVLGAVVAEDPPVFDRALLGVLELTEEELAKDVAAARAEAHRRETVYRQGRPAPRLADRTVVLVDDGLATGSTARAALRHLRARDPARLLLAVPVASPDIAIRMRQCADEIICLHKPEHFRAVGQWYVDFHHVEDSEVVGTLRTFHAKA